MNKEIKWVCWPCGISASVVTALWKYHEPPRKPSYNASTYHLDVCDFCNKEALITQVRDFFYPDFELLDKIMQDLSTRMSYA